MSAATMSRAWFLRKVAHVSEPGVVGSGRLRAR